MSLKPKTLYQFALEGSSVKVQFIGRMCILDLGMQGKYICNTQDFVRSREWAKGRLSSNNLRNDRTLFLDRLGDFLSEKGEGLATSRGQIGKLAGLIPDMENMNISLKAYFIPVSLQEYFKQKGQPLEC